jgi:hypothetical protein
MSMHVPESLNTFVPCASPPRSPVESQGATLYDVFQRIGRCEYQPLPADRWSSPLRQLVSRLLQPEPTKRPSLREVCSLAQQIVTSQVRSERRSYRAVVSVLALACTVGVPLPLA